MTTIAAPDSLIKDRMRMSYRLFHSKSAQKAANSAGVVGAATASGLAYWAPRSPADSAAVAALAILFKTARGVFAGATSPYQSSERAEGKLLTTGETRDTFDATTIYGLYAAIHCIAVIALAHTPRSANSRWIDPVSSPLNYNNSIARRDSDRKRNSYTQRNQRELHDSIHNYSSQWVSS